MMKKFFLFLLVLSLIVFGIRVNAQCATAGSVTTTITTTANTCAGNGTITATFSSAINTTIQLLKGGTIVQSVIAPTSPHTFTNLQPGTDYQVKIVCSIDNSIVYSNNNPITVADSYIPISNADISISNVCTNFTQGGTFTVNNVTGGTPNYMYLIVKSLDPAFPDQPLNYVTSNVLNVTEFGTYQIRVRDACGNYKTFTKELNASLAPVKFYFNVNKSCGTNIATIGHAWSVDANTDQGIDLQNHINAGGLMLEIYEQASNGSCAPQGAALYTGTYTGSSFTMPLAPSKKYYVKTTSPCGLIATYCWDTAFLEVVDFSTSTSISGCGTSETMVINGDAISAWTYPVNVVVKNSSGTQVYTTTLTAAGTGWSSSVLPLDTYTVTYSDTCSPVTTLTKTVEDPANAGTPTLSLQYVGYICDNGNQIATHTVTGTAQVIVRILGYFSDYANATLTILSGPSNVGVAGYSPNGEYWAWSNMLPGDYTVAVTSCGVTNIYPFTVDSSSLLQQSVTSTGTSYCSGGGTISSTKIYNGGYPSTVELYNASNLSTPIATDVNGYFANIPAGTYVTKLKVTSWCNQSYYIDGNTVLLTDSNTGPSITASTGVICEDSAGVPLATGSAYLDIAGVSPYEIQYRVAGSTGAYAIINTSSSSLQIDNLTANTTYEIILKDACGGSFPSTIQIKTMGNLAASNTAQSCPGSPYTLIMPYYAGAVYQWLDSSGNVLSNTRTYTFPNYAAANDGTYTCKITWSTCVTRFVNLTLNSTVCGAPIGGACYKPATTGTGAIPTKHGITSLGRAGADNGNWPMVRTGAWTALESKTKGFVMNRVVNPSTDIANPAKGMMVYDTTVNCLKINTDGTASGWKCFSTQTCPTVN
ncbi:hypothetical protein ASG31_10380 [Chryseobacterium sp. Leaf404]|uniref:hypothetical protein n=1 Tax=unclassified Chryseobacterium TaxID=2593645 RepID=UPI0006F241A9|nr:MULTISPECIES: hypothetical protein [unclassified Chryseobacterium]KQT16777.1 hypothetical protein ASG31_10380 [Chryseobacterium sp. Leaf404]